MKKKFKNYYHSPFTIVGIYHIEYPKKLSKKLSIHTRTNYEFIY